MVVYFPSLIDRARQIGVHPYCGGPSFNITQACAALSGLLPASRQRKAKVSSTNFSETAYDKVRSFLIRLMEGSQGIYRNL